MVKLRNLAGAAVAGAVLAACSSSSPPAATGPSTSTTSTTSKGGGSPASLPAPCTLVTTADVTPVFGAAAVTATPSTGPAPGTAACSFSLTAGSQGRNVIVKTRNDYANDPSYVFPSGTHITGSGLGDFAVVETMNAQKESTITVKLGKNALEIMVNFYDQPVDNSSVTQLAKEAVARA
jgi:hypothetical protein